VIGSGTPGGGRTTRRGARIRSGAPAPAPAPDDARASLVAAATSFLAERSAADISVEEICDTAGVSRAQFRTTFAGRGELLLAVFDRLVGEAAAEIAPAYRAQPGWLDGVRSALDAMLSFLDRRRGLARFLVVDSLRCDPSVLVARAAVLDRLARELGRGRPEPGAGTAPAPFGAEALVAAAASILHGRLLVHGTEPLSELSGSLMGMIVMPYLGVEATRSELSRHTSDSGLGGDGGLSAA
jgi:AcrR family transcriptional regulator